MLNSFDLMVLNEIDLEEFADEVMSNPHERAEYAESHGICPKALTREMVIEIEKENR